MKIFITGIHGFIGTNLSKHLISQGHEVFGDRKGSWQGEYDIRSVPNVSNETELFGSIAYYEPDIVINSATRKGSDYCDINPSESLESNVIGTRNVVRICNSLDIPLIHYGTTSYYHSTDKKFEITEESIRNSQNFYSVTKLMQEFIVKDMATVPWMIIEPVFLYGNVGEYEASRSESVPDLMVRLLEEPDFGPVEVRISPRWVKDYTYISDFVWMMERIIQDPNWGERITVGAGYNQEFGEVYEEECELLQAQERIIFLHDTDYKKHQVHNYGKLLSLYPEWGDRNKISMREFMDTRGEIN